MNVRKLGASDKLKSGNLPEYLLSGYTARLSPQAPTLSPNDIDTSPFLPPTAMGAREPFHTILLPGASIWLFQGFWHRDP
jgi:hypothetical protein